jgi:hypothetical protein
MKLKNEANCIISESAQFAFIQSTNVPIGNHHLPTIGSVEGTKNMHQRAFAGTGFTYNCNNLGSIYTQIHAFQYMKGSEALMKVICRENAQCNMVVMAGKL